MKKKNWLALAASLILPVLAHAGCEDYFQTWMNKLHPQRTLDTDHAVCKDWPANDALMVAALPFPHADNSDDQGIFDLEVLVADRATGTIIAHVYQPSAITSDAVRFSGLTLDTARYQLSKDNRAFGVRVSNQSLSRADSFGTTALSLYAIEGQKLRTVLDRLTVESNSSGDSGECSASYDTTTRTIDMGAIGSNGVAALKVSEKSIHSVDKKVGGECKSHDDAPVRATFTLDYRNGHYAIPKGMSDAS